MTMLDQIGDIDLQRDELPSGVREASPEIFWPEAIARGGVGKRLFDISIALVALVILLPLFVFVTIAVKMTSAGPVFYGHKRVGFGRRRFKCWKFRTMCVDADKVLEQCLIENPALRQEWQATQKLKDDPRVTRLGRVLRDYSVDELPQLINVLTGDMSFVGPRPVVDSELERYGDKAGLYLSARPGVTGLWQISGRSDTSYAERVRLDSQYILNWSYRRDVEILLKTVPAVIGARGSY